MIYSRTEWVATLAAVAIVPASLALGLFLMEVPCYADFCIEHVQPMAKRSSRIALGVFYVWIAAVVIVMGLARRNPALQAYLHKPVTLGSPKTATTFSIGELFFFLSITALLAFNFGFFYQRSDDLLNTPAYVNRKLHPSRRMAFWTTMFTGKLTDVSLGIIMLLASKNTGMQTLLGVSFDRGVRAHRWVGYFFVLAVAAHTILYIVYTAQYRSYEDLISVLFAGSNKSAHKDHLLGWGEGNWMVTMGTLSTLLLLLASLFSLPIIRRRFFTLFYATHFLLIPSMIFACLHAASDFYYIIPGLGLYIVDLALRVRALRKCVNVVGVVREPTGHVRVDFEWPEGLGSVKAGQWVCVNVPGVDRLAWHPYSLAQSPNSPTGTIFFNPPISPKSTQFEAKLAAALLPATKPDPESPRALTLALDGPFGVPGFEMTKKYDVVVCFAAGTGLAPAVSVARHVRATAGDVCVVWSVKEQGGEGVSLVKELASEGIQCRIRHTGVTELSVDDTEDTTTTTVPTEKFTNLPHIVPTTGRMNVKDILTSTTPHTTLALFICGPPAFLTHVRREALAFTQTQGVDVTLWEEGFEM
ncbi:hypothetical protein HK104_004554 [Borealophlyctis nickersoniae]|nr:hypothetical protein HK104_004554 [Borealophlyctis nickersoniae]